MSQPPLCRLLALAALVGALSGAVATPAAAQEGWGATPLPLPGASPAGAASLGVDAAGTLTVVWLEGSLASGGTLKAARHAKATGLWTVPSTLANVAQFSTFGSLDLVVDDAGNAVVVWATGYYRNNNPARASRYEAATESWTTVDLPTTANSTGRPRVAGNAAGDAVVLWNEESLASGGIPPRVQGVLVRRFLSSTGTWSTAERLAVTLPVESWLRDIDIDIAIDGGRNIQVVWSGLGETAVQTTRFAAVGGTWGPVSDLSAPLIAPSAPLPQVKMNDAGDAVATWSGMDSVFATRFATGGTTWTTPAVVATGVGAAATQPAIDPGGNITLAWTSGPSDSRAVAVARFVATTGSWSAPAVLAAPGSAPSGLTVGADPLGNAFVVWSQSEGNSGPRVRATRYAMSSATWDAPHYLSVAGQPFYNGSVAIDGVGNAFVARLYNQTPAIGAVVLRWHATPSAPVTTGIAPTSGALSVSVTAPPTSDPAFAATNFEYSLDNGATWLARIPATMTSPLTISGLTDGVVYALRVRAVNSAGAGTATEALAVRAGATATLAPLRVVAITGTVVTLAWSSPDGIIPTGHLVEGGLAPQQTLASVATGSAASSLTASFPSGIFYLRIVAVSGGTRLGTSNEVRLVVNVPAAPSPPTDLVGTAMGSNLALSWTNTLSGGPPTGLVLNVSGPVSGSAPLPVTEGFSYAGVPPGRYTFSVTAMNASGPSAPSPPLTLDFPGECAGQFNPPADFVATATPGAAFLTWNPPVGGPPITGYQLQVSGAVNGVLNVTARTLATAASPGSYTVSVRAVTACGSGAATPPQTLVVP